MTAILAVLNNINAPVERDFNAWYNQQHLSERVAVPGFNSGRRYRALKSDTKHQYLAWYETESSAVLSSPEYLGRLQDPTRWTLKIMPHFRDTVRTVMTQEAKVGEGSSSYVGLVNVNPGSASDDIRRWLKSDGLSALVDGIDITAAEYWLADPDHDASQTTEGQLRRGTDATMAGTIVIHATQPDALSDRVVPWTNALADRGGVVHDKLASYALLFSLR